MRPTPASRARDDRRIRIVERVEVRVGVDHAAGAGASTRGKSGAAGSIPSAASATPARDPVERQVVRLTKRLQDPRRGLGKVRRERDGDGDDPVGEVVEDGVELGRPCFVLGQVPRRRRLDVLVEGTNRLPDRLERARDVVAVEVLDDRRAQGGRVEGARAGRPRQAPVAVARDHRRRPGDEVAEVVRELGLVALTEAVERDVAVLPERHLSRTPEADRVGAVDVDQIERVDRVAQGLRDLLLVDVQVAVHEELAGRLVAGREQQRRPVDAVETEDVLAEEMHRGPEPLEVLAAAA